MWKTISLVAALSLTGCGSPKPLPMAATPESAQTALVACLDAWKQGKTREEMETMSPSLYFGDDDLNRGAKLLDYSIAGEGKPAGTGYSYIVNARIQDKAGTKQRDKKIAYRVVTEPKCAVTREDRQP
jgi:hypothetical protein